LRHELLPLLIKHYQPALPNTTLRLMEVLEAEASFVTQTAMDWLKGKQPSFCQLPIAVQRRALYIQLQRLGFKTEFELIEHLRINIGTPLTLIHGLNISRDTHGMIQVQHVKNPVFHETGHIRVELSGKRGAICFGGLGIRWVIEPRLESVPWLQGRSAGSRAKTGRECFDADKVGSTIALRHWLPGDRFQPIGMPSSVKLQDLFVNLKIPRVRRHQVVVAATAIGDLFWVEGLRISERFKLDRSTSRRLVWRWETD
jgi:tRNA(Ile)-lysidine synthetase-like protein